MFEWCTSVCKANIVKCIIFLASIFLKIYACALYNYYWDYGVLIKCRYGTFPGICECWVMNQMVGI